MSFNQKKLSQRKFLLKQYIGDSVWADFDGYRIVLTTENGIPSRPSNKIAIEPSILKALNRYHKWVREELKNKKQKSL